MSESDKVRPDWIHLPASVEEVSLWDSLHDGEIRACSSDLGKRSVQLDVSIRHLLNESEKATNVNFLLRVYEVNSVRALIHARPTEKFQEPADDSREERGRLLEEYFATWRSESLSWPLFEEALSTDPLMISDAAFTTQDKATALRIGGFLDGQKFDDIYCDIFIRGSHIVANRSDGQALTFEDFIKLGKDYWEAFSNRKRDKSQT